MFTFVTIVNAGEYDSFDSFVVYAGCNAIDAYLAGKAYDDEGRDAADRAVNAVWVEVWKDGKKVADKDIDGTYYSYV